MAGLDGRRPQPSAIAQLRGNPGHRPAKSTEPEPPRGAPPKPAHLGDIASTEWDRLVLILDREMRVLTVSDGDALTQLVTATEQERILSEAIADNGYTYESETKNGVMIRPRPEVAMRAEAQRQIEKWLAHFGLTPATRTKVSVRDGDEKQGKLFQFQRSA